MQSKVFVRLLPFLIVSLLCCPAWGGSWGIWPLVSYQAADGQRELEVLGPIFTWKQTREGEQWGVRPFFYYTHYPSQELWRWEFLYPLGKYQRRGADRKFYLVPFSLFRDEVTYPFPEGRERAASVLTAFWGQTDKGERYGGLFPLAGRLKERFSRDEIEFYLWPLYSRIKDEGEITWRIFWPFFSLTRGEAKGLYLWPLWGQKVRPGVYSKGFYLWPLYVYMDEDLDTDNPVRKRYYLPLYASIRSRRGKVDLFLPPFFFHQRGYVPTFEKWEVPWPILTLVRGEGVREWKVFPLFRLRKEQSRRRLFFLWPLYKYELDLMEGEREEVRRFFLINKYRLVRRTDTGRESVDVNLWPFFDYQKGFDGGVKFYVFPLLPLHDEGMERNIYPLFWVYRYTRSPEGETYYDLLWGLYRRRGSSRGWSLQLAFLLRLEKKGHEVFSLSLLAGLFRYRRTKEGGKWEFFSFR